ncbi:hypothetical protein [Corynebacterium freiburgense]|nr:hypothetical protein [Corynebacterium freiburgense]WJZ01976.1 hypothetical protein CFREI_03365 [Corynebacterium freiburgense]
MADVEKVFDEDTSQEYLDLLRKVNDEWTELERNGDESVQLSSRVITAIQEAVRSEVKYGRQVQMPPTAFGPYSISELTLRNLVRVSVDSIEGALALHSDIITNEENQAFFERGLPERLVCYISVRVTCPDYQAVAQNVRNAIATACAEQLGLYELEIDIHIEDLHDE